MSGILKEDCLMHSPIKNCISWFDREDISFKTRYFQFGVWVSVTNWDNLKSCCIECYQSISIRLKKMKVRWDREKNANETNF